MRCSLWWRIFPARLFFPKAAEIALFPRAIQMQQLFLVASRVVARPLLNVRYANLIEQGGRSQRPQLRTR
jgi:hypothetical protein